MGSSGTQKYRSSWDRLSTVAAKPAMEPRFFTYFSGLAPCTRRWMPGHHHRRMSSVNFWGQNIFCPKIYAWKINKMSEFYMIFARKINKIPEFYMICARKKLTKCPNILHDFCQKNIFSTFWGKCPLYLPRLLRLWSSFLRLWWSVRLCSVGLFGGPLPWKLAGSHLQRDGINNLSYECSVFSNLGGTEKVGLN